MYITLKSCLQVRSDQRNLDVIWTWSPGARRDIGGMPGKASRKKGIRLEFSAILDIASSLLPTGGLDRDLILVSGPGSDLYMLHFEAICVFHMVGYGDMMNCEL